MREVVTGAQINVVGGALLGVGTDRGDLPLTGPRVVSVDYTSILQHRRQRRPQMRQSLALETLRNRLLSKKVAQVLTGLEPQRCS